MANFGVGLFAIYATRSTTGSWHPQGSGALFAVLGGGMFAVIQAFAAMSWVAASRLEQRRDYTLVVAAFALCLLHQPLGLALGVFGIIVLSRPSVKALFQA